MSFTESGQITGAGLPPPLAAMHELPFQNADRNRVRQFDKARTDAGLSLHRALCCGVQMTCSVSQRDFRLRKNRSLPAAFDQCSISLRHGPGFGSL
jgi:hypothetical protein